MLRYVVDENLRGTLAVAATRYATRLGLDLDVIQIGDRDGPPLGSHDPEVLEWAENSGRILVSRDRKTLPEHLAQHLAAGRNSPGIILVKRRPLMEIAEYLVIIAFASDPEEWRNKISYIPP
jgi:hypothetical protein